MKKYFFQKSYQIWTIVGSFFQIFLTDSKNIDITGFWTSEHGARNVHKVKMGRAWCKEHLYICFWNQWEKSGKWAYFGSNLKTFLKKYCSSSKGPSLVLTTQKTDNQPMGGFNWKKAGYHLKKNFVDKNNGSGINLTQRAIFGSLRKAANKTRILIMTKTVQRKQGPIWSLDWKRIFVVSVMMV